MSDKLEETFEEWYCFYCGSAQKKNTVKNKKKGDYTLTCTLCGIMIRFYVMSPATKTKSEADEAFDKTPLTDRQETGRANTGKYARKRKYKK